MIEKEDFTSELSGALKAAIGFFDGLAWDSLADHKEKLEDLDVKSEKVMEEAINLIKRQ
jgi:hypothetical protein